MRTLAVITAIILTSLATPRLALAHASELHLLDRRLSLAAAGNPALDAGTSTAGGSAFLPPTARWDVETTLVCIAAAGAGVFFPFVVGSFALADFGNASRSSAAIIGSVGLAALVLVPPLAARLAVGLWDLEASYPAMVLGNVLGLAVAIIPVAIAQGSHASSNTKDLVTLAVLAIPALATTTAAYLTNAPRVLPPPLPPSSAPSPQSRPRPGGVDEERQAAQDRGLEPSPFRLEPPAVFTVQALALRFL